MVVITSVGDGDWEAPGTWDVAVPTIDDEVVIAHIVTINDENAVAWKVTVNLDKALHMECVAGPTKLQFKDAAGAVFLVNGWFRMYNTSAVNTCTIYGGSATNMVEYTKYGQGAIYDDYFHIGYIYFKWNVLMYQSCWIDYSIKTRNWVFSVWLANHKESYLIPHGEDLVWTVEVQAEWAENINLQTGHHLHIEGTSDYWVKIEGLDATHRVLGAIYLDGGQITANYWKVDQFAFRIFQLGRHGGIKLTNCDLHAIENWVEGWAALPMYIEDTILESDYRIFRVSALHWILKNCTFIDANGSMELYGGNQIDAIGDNLTGLDAINLGEKGDLYLNWYKEITVTVNDAAGDPIQGAYVELAQERADIYRDTIFLNNPRMTDGGITDVSGQVTLLGIHKQEYNQYRDDTTTYWYSDSVENGPGGSPENHKLIVHSWGYVSHEEDVVCDADKAVTVTLGSLSLPELTVEIEDQELEVVIA